MENYQRENALKIDLFTFVMIAIGLKIGEAKEMQSSRLISALREY